jgi:type I restriction enzyme M protein
VIHASKSFRKDGPKNRLREQDIHKIVDTFRRQDESDPRYARVVPIDEIADPKNAYNLNRCTMRTRASEYSALA